MTHPRALDDARLEPPADYIDDPFDGDPCPHCDDTGEIWADIEHPSGRVGETMRPCPCGGAA